MTFSRGLRSILRQDPDIILVGEVRDGETAELALKASLTGHMVLTTLHTNSAVAALTRLVDMGAEPFLVASSLTAAVAQRLVRRPCDSCAAPYVPDEVTLAGLGLSEHDLADATPRRGAGCPDCGGTGYRGRTAVYEVLSVGAAMRQVLVHDPAEESVSAQARAEGMLTLRAAAIDKARRGETTFEEAVRVTHSDHSSQHDCPSCQRRDRAGHGGLPVVRGHPRPRPLRALRPQPRPGLEDLPLVPHPRPGTGPHVLRRGRRGGSARQRPGGRSRRRRPARPARLSDPQVRPPGSARPGPGAPAAPPA